MGGRIAIIGTGAVGGYVGAHMAQAGEDVTLVDFWPENVETIRTTGLHISHAGGMPEFTTPVAGIVGWGKTLGSIASAITVELCGPGHVRRASSKRGAGHTVFRVGEVHGLVTDRAREICRLLALADSAKVTQNLWGERWTKLVVNAMANGVSASTGLVSRDILLDDRLRHFTARLGSEAIRVGEALGYQIEEIHGLDPEMIARAGEGDVDAKAGYDERRLAEARKPGGGHRPSMGQDMVKGRRTEIEFLNGFIVDKSKEVGVPTPANAALTDIVKRVEKGDLRPDKRHILELRLN